MLDLKLERRGSGGENSKLEHHEIICPVIGAVNVYIQVSHSFTKLNILCRITYIAIRLLFIVPSISSADAE